MVSEKVILGLEGTFAEKALQEAILRVIEKHDTGDGTKIELIYTEIEVAKEQIKENISQLLAVGEIYEPKRGVLKIL